MGRYRSSDSDSDYSRSSRKRKKDRRARSRSRSESNSSGSRHYASLRSKKSKKSKKRSNRKDSISPDRYQSYHKDHSRSRRSRSRSKDRRASRRSRSPEVSRYRSKSPSYSRDRRSRSNSRGHRRSRSNSRGHRRSRSGSKGSRHRVKSHYRHRSRSRSNSRTGDRSRHESEERYKQGHSTAMKSSELAEMRMRKALQAAAIADEMVRDKDSSYAGMKELSLASSKNFADSVAAIESDSFVPASFKSSGTVIKDEPNVDPLMSSHDDAIFGSLSSAGFTIKPDLDNKPVCLDPESIMHPRLFCDVKEKMERWIDRLSLLRRKKLEGEAIY